MKSGTFTNNTSFSATAASIQIPAGSQNVTVDYGENEQIIIPNNITVVQVDACYIGVTPNKKYTLIGWTPFVHHTGDEYPPFLQSMSGVYWSGEAPEDTPDTLPATFTIRWSADINTHKPYVTDY